MTELLQKRMQAIGEARNYAARAQGEQRAMTALERESCTRAMDAVDALGAEYRSQPIDTGRGSAFYPSSGSARYAAFRRWLSTGGAISDDEKRALQMDSDTAGGFLVVPVQTAVGVLTKLDDLLFIRAKGTVLPPLPANTQAIPVADSPADADWTAEIGATGFDNTMTTGSRALSPKLIVKGIKVSSRLLRISEGRAEAAVQDRLAYKLAVPQEKAFLTGTGAGQPLGLFTASDHGVSTGRDITTGSTTTAVTADSFINAKYNVKAQYHRKGEWVLSRDTTRAAMLLKDGSGRYIWESAEAPGDPDLILGKAVNMSEYAPNTFTTGLYVGLFGDLSFFHIADYLPELQRLDEKYAETNQTAFIARSYTDGMPTIEDAFSRMRLA